MQEIKPENGLYQTILTAALKEANERELAGIPPEEELAKSLSFSPEFSRRMGALKRKAAREHRARRIPLYAGRAAVAALAVFSTLCAALFLTPEVRASVRHIMTQWFDTYAYFTFMPEEEAFDGVWEAKYLPRNFYLEKDRSGEPIRVLEFRSLKDERLTLRWAPAETAAMSVDTEHSTHIIIEMDSGEGHLFEGFDGYPTMLLWERQGTSFLLTSDLKDNREILRVAENLEPVEIDEGT